MSKLFSLLPIAALAAPIVTAAKAKEYTLT